MTYPVVQASGAALPGARAPGAPPLPAAVLPFIWYFVARRGGWYLGMLLLDGFLPDGDVTEPAEQPELALPPELTRPSRMPPDPVEAPHDEPEPSLA